MKDWAMTGRGKQTIFCFYVLMMGTDFLHPNSYSDIVLDLTIDLFIIITELVLL